MASLSLRPITADDAAAIVAWRYPPPYDVYDMEPGAEAELLEPSNDYHAVVDETGELVGMGTFGDAIVDGGDYGEPAVDIGYGLRPESIGRGLGRPILAVMMDDARRRAPDLPIRVTVATANAAEMHIVTTSGFGETSRFPSARDGNEFAILVQRSPGTRNR